jgi:predicted TIM-barrel fold metal-dependent hydrolase
VGRFDARVNTPPGEIFRRQCWISCDPDERSVAAIVELVGTDRFFWASDYPHSEAKPGAMQDLGELGQALTRAAREELFGASAARLYGIELR